jgi:hypothetical protein
MAAAQADQPQDAGVPRVQCSTLLLLLPLLPLLSLLLLSSLLLLLQMVFVR